MVPGYLLSGSGCESRICYGCDAAVKANPTSGRWFVTMGHPGFNSRANNREGYATAEAARAAIAKYGRR